MLQFYFLSVLLNVVTGLVLVYATDFNKQTPDEGDAAGQTQPAEKEAAQQGGSGVQTKIDRFGKIIGSNSFFDDMTFRLVLGILTGLVGIMKLLSVVQNDMPVIGDLIPALAGMCGSVCILLEYYKFRTTLEPHVPSFIKSFFEGGRKYIGVFCVAAGLLHFIFPKVLFL